MKQLLYLLPLICALLVVGPIEAKKKKYSNGDYYEGEWKKGAPHGIGTMKYADGSVYEGNWELGKRNGQGTMKYVNGDVYEGNWELGEKNGHGILKYRNGDTYDGKWIKGTRSGRGTMKYANKNVYEGNWVAGMINGHGTMKYANGGVYVGMWQNGKKHGQGNMSTNGFNPCVETGEWHNDKLYNGKTIKDTQLGQAITEYKIGLGKTFLKNKNDGWEFKGQLSDSFQPLLGTITKGNHKIFINNYLGKYTATLYFKNGSKEFEEIPSPNEANAFNKWVASAFSKIASTDIKNEQILAQERAKAAQQIKEFELQKKKEEIELNRNRVISQIPYYIWEATDIRSVYENNPARFRTLTQNKYVIIGGTIADIDESKNFEYNQFLQDWIEYKYYTIRLSGGVYFESRNTEFVSKLNRGQELLFVGLYTDKQSFNRPLFDLKMYAGSTQDIIKLILDNGISLSNLVKR